MSAHAGWYHYEGDPADTVRLWNGQEWIGFPTAAAGAEQHRPAAAAQRQPFKNQRRLVVWALLGAAGLLATVGTGAIVLWDLIAALRSMQDLGVQEAEVAALAHVSENPTGANFGVAGLGGGVLFLMWLFLANRNLGGNALGASQKGKTVGEQYLGRSTIFFGLFFSPIIRRVTNLIEYSGAGPDRGKMSPFGPFTWLALWMASVVGAAVVFLSGADNEGVFSQDAVLILAAFLAAHLLSLLFALKFLIQITVYQDRRLRR